MPIVKMRKRQHKRIMSLLPQGTPKYVRCYDNGEETSDRYTVVFTGNYTMPDRIYLGMSTNPFHPQGIGQHGFSDSAIDRPRYAHLGKKIPFLMLPDKCKQAVIQTYCAIWNLKDEEGNWI